MVRTSTQHGMYEALQRFHPSMPCAQRGISWYCRAHNTDHDPFVHYMHLLGFAISFPPVTASYGQGHVMCRAAFAWQATAIHAWMDEGYHSLREAHAAGWPLDPWQWNLQQHPP